MDWYRRYHGTCRDEKIEIVAQEAGLPRPYAIAGWDGVLEYASQQPERGSTEGLDARRLAITIGCSLDEASKLLVAFEAVGLIVDGQVAKWKDRQFQSDTSTERVKRFREKKQNVTAKEEKRCSDVTEAHQNRSEQIRDSTFLRNAAVAAPSDPDDDAKAAADPLGYAFRVLVGAGIKRSLVAKWRHKLPDPAANLLDVVAALEAERPDDPTSWFSAACQARAGPKKIIGKPPEDSIWQY